MMQPIKNINYLQDKEFPYYLIKILLFNMMHLLHIDDTNMECKKRKFLVMES